MTTPACTASKMPLPFRSGDISREVKRAFVFRLTRPSIQVKLFTRKKYLERQPTAAVFVFGASAARLEANSIPTCTIQTKPIPGDLVAAHFAG